MSYPTHRRHTFIALLTSVALFAGCGGGTSSAPPPPSQPVAVSVTAPGAMLQAGRSAKFTATVANSPNKSVSWAVNGTPGGTAAIGLISLDGVYTAPATVADTTDVKITATAQADSSKFADATLSIFAAPRIRTRVVEGSGEFYDAVTGAKFTPRGMNYTRIGFEVILPFNVNHEWLTTVSVGSYNASEVEAAFAAMEAQGYNVVRVIMDCCGATGGLGNPAGDGVNPAYLANLADFLKRARAHHIYTIANIDDLPKAGGYQQTIGPDCFAAWPSCNNLTYTTTAGINAERKFWRDFVSGLVAQKAPMDAILGYELRNEYYYPPESQKAEWAPLPLLPTSGNYTAANGKTYDMADPVSRRKLMDESLTYWADRAREVIQEIAPGALVGVGSVTGDNPYVPKYSAAAASTLDFIDAHGGPGEGETVGEVLIGWGKPAAPTSKPVIFGEFAASLASFASETDAAAALRQWQIDSCTYGMSGWLLWSWDTHEQDTLGWPHWYATRASGLVGHTLAPTTRPDPCAP